MATYAEPEKRLPRSFWALNASQSIVALNDNVFQWVMALAMVARFSHFAADGTLVKPGWPLFLCGALMAIPYILFSSWAGILADRYSKRVLIRTMAFAAVPAMLLGTLSLALNSPVLCCASLFLMLTQSAFFSPAKIGILPEIVPRERLSYANGIFEACTYLAIILGTVGGALLYRFVGAADTEVGASMASCWKGGAVCVALAVAGFLASLPVEETGIRSVTKADASPWFWQDVARNLRAYRANRYLFLTLFAIGFFLFLGNYVRMNVTMYGMDVLGWSEASAPNLFLVMAFGIGAGSYLAGKGSGRGIELGFVPVGAGIISLSALLFGLHITTAWAAIPLLFLIGLGAGFYIVPLDAFLQQSAPQRDRGELIATANFLQFCGVFLASGLLFGLEALHVAPGARFAIIGFIMLVLTVAVIRILPDFLVRFIGLIVTRIIYRLDVVGRENVPLEGGALFVGNHVSYVDAALIGSSHPRRVRFVMEKEFYEHPWFHWLFRLMQCIPISAKGSPKELVRSLRAARQALDDGYIVCIFAEGELTRTGAIGEFRRGFERIVQGTHHPVIPVNLHGIWGSTFTYYNGRAMARWGRWGRRVTVSFGKPLPSSVGTFELRTAVQELESAAFERDRARHESLPVEFARVARGNWRRLCMSDTIGRRLHFGHTLTSALALADALRAETHGQQCVGLLVPQSVAGALANLAVAFLGKVSVNLNYTASRASLESAVARCSIQRIVTSRAFLQRLGSADVDALREMATFVYLEDVAQSLTATAKFLAFLRARFVPARLLVAADPAARIGHRRPGVDDTATILFSSGTTGEPKGVMLTHYNILANVQGAQQVFRLGAGDVVAGTLPFFHSFGLTVTLWLPVLTGFAAAYHTSPLDSARIGCMVADERCTLLVATPTFLMNYTRKVPREQFATLRFIITGAEKLKPAIAAAFREKFGVEPMEGYGTTELSPVAAVNVLNVESGGVSQTGNKPGSIGRPLPGVTMKIVDPENLDRDLGYDREGLLLVKGPSVMKGYLGRPDKTAEVIHNGWYVTGDVARIAHDGFVEITDRLSRFSKIAGEMVPHLAIEDKIQELLGKTEPVCAVTSVPDPKRGERLVVLLTPEAGDAAEVHRLLRASGLPNLWMPAASDFRTIEALPMLGSGKLDLKALRDLAEKGV